MLDYLRAQAVLPAGGFGNFDPGIMIARGSGSYVWDEDGNEYIDYLIGSGPMFWAAATPKFWKRFSNSSPKV
jgi:glutamate-1-semialdehyde 2,1-aminomutase